MAEPLSGFTLETPPTHTLDREPGLPASFRILEHELVDLNLLAFYPHRHEFYEIILILEGEGSHVVDFSPLEVDPPTLHFVSPGQIHFWELDTRPHMHSILFTEDFLLPSADNPAFLYNLSFFHTLDRPQEIVLREPHCRELLDLVLGMHDEYGHSRFGRETILRSLLTTLLVKAQRLVQPLPDTKDSREANILARRFIRLAARRYDTERSVSAYARALNVTPGHLADVVKDATGRSPGRIIREQVLLEAKRLLAHSEQSVAEIGYHLAFDDPSYFGRFFRREVGESPGEFRRRIRDRYQLSSEISL